jgi:hypothetical protein
MLRAAIAAVAGALLLGVLNAVTYGLVISDAVEANRTAYEGLVKDPPDLIPYFLYGLLWMSLLAYAFKYWANIRSFARGAVAGAVFWGATVLGLNLNSVAHFNLLENFFVIVPMKVAAAAIVGALVGGVMAAILGWGNREGSIR